MSQTHKISFLVTLTFIFLLPIFFIPGGALSLSVAKSTLFSIGIVIAFLIFLFEIWREEKLNIPWHPFILIIVLLPLIYALSALLSTSSSLSLFGYNFEVGTFGFMLFSSIILILVATIFSDTSRILQALVAFFVSISITVLFITIKILFGGDVLVWGNFFGNMGNPIGNWTDLAVSFGLLSAFIALTLGMIPMKFSIKIFTFIVFVLGVMILAIINFSIAFVLTLVAAVFLSIYFFRVEKHFFRVPTTLPSTSGHSFLKLMFLPITLGIISLVYLINPTISETRGTLGDVFSSTFKVTNIDVRPSFSATLGISKAVLSQDSLLGSGPNTFGRDWLVYKPIDVNSTPFWATSFPFGIGFIPTQIASTGLLGSILWIALFVFLVLLGILALNHIPESRDDRFALVSTLLLTVLLWISSFLYAPSVTILVLTFIFSGIFVAVSMKIGIIPIRVIDFRKSQSVHLISILVLVIMTLGALFLGWLGVNKTVSAFYFKKAIDLSNTTNVSLVEVESYLNNAVRFAPVDIHYVALSRINFAKAQTASSVTTGTPEENRVIFGEAIRKSIEMAKIAISLNPASYDNWVSLGVIYSALVPSPLLVEGAYENAQFAYSEASQRNPNNPALPLLLARLELNRGDKVAARSFIRKSLVLKENYADAYLLLAQLEVQEGNTTLAIASAEKLAVLMPNNSGIYFELGLLKYSNEDYRGAVEAFNLALISAPDYANAKYYLGLALIKLLRFDEAQSEFEALLLTNPDSVEVRDALEILRKRSNPL